MNEKLNDLVIRIRGAGEMATGAAHRLASCHFKVCMAETPNPQAVRIEVAFSEAIKARTISGGVPQAILEYFNG
jgi:xanthine dehydrogenase accessory factor